MQENQLYLLKRFLLSSIGCLAFLSRLEKCLIAPTACRMSMRGPDKRITARSRTRGWGFVTVDRTTFTDWSVLSKRAFQETPVRI